MSDVKLGGQDKKDLLEFIDAYSKKISINDISEIENKLNKKISIIRRKKSLPEFAKKMLFQVEDLATLLSSPTISNDKLDRVIAALHYFIWAEDKIPDYIPVLGYLDDAFVISIVHRGSKKEIDAIKEKNESKRL